MEEKNKLEVGWNWRRYCDLWVLGAEGWVAVMGPRVAKGPASILILPHSAGLPAHLSNAQISSQKYFGLFLNCFGFLLCVMGAEGGQRSGGLHQFDAQTQASIIHFSA